jgi:hypothetical protein
MSERFIGKGVEKRVYEDPSNPDRVLKVYNYESTSLPEVKAQYHFGKLLHILFPENIPDTFQVGQREGETTTIIAERRKLDSDHLRANQLANTPAILNEVETEEYDAIKTRQKASGLGDEIVRNFKSLNIAFDTLQKNFSHQDSGHDVYLDTINPWKFERPKSVDGSPDLNRKKYLVLNFDETAITTRIDTIADEHQKRQAYMHLGRIKALADLERTEKNSLAWGPF